jgi:hypothetical protein
VTVSFTIPTDGYANMRFWLDVTNHTDNTHQTYGGKFGNGFLIPPAADGVVILDQHWFDEQGISFNEGETTVKVLLGNDKFGFDAYSAEWSKEAKFSVGAAAQRDGKISVKVRHPLVNLTNVVVAVYETEDLVNPVAYTNSTTTNHVIIGGLRSGVEYYVAAWYVKDRADGRTSIAERAPYDTWGYYCNVSATNTSGICNSHGFDPITVKSSADAEEVVVYLQDTDWNDNGLIDREEDFIAIAGFYERGLIPNYGFEIEGAVEYRTSTSAGSTMAYAKVEFPLVAITNELGEAVWYAVVSGDAVSSNKVNGLVAVGTPLSELELASTYYYGEELALGTNVVFAAGSIQKVVESVVGELVLVHAQVLDYFGFDPRTANGNTGNEPIQRKEL